MRMVCIPTVRSSRTEVCLGLQLYQKRDSGTGFPVNFAKFLTTPFLIKHLRWLLLHSFNEKPVSKKQSTTAEKKTE